MANTPVIEKFLQAIESAMEAVKLAPTLVPAAALLPLL